MQQALALARQACETGEVPVGAVLVHQGQVIATGHNAPIGTHDPTAHAEIRALREAATRLGNYRLEDCELFVTLEPCPMCAGALLHARLKRVVFGAPDPKTGAAGSVLNLFANRQLNHQTEVHGGVLMAECGELLQEFFQRKRDTQRRLNQPLREDALRTPEERFTGLPDYPWPPHYLNDLPVLAGLRLHYLDEGPHDAPLTWLCLHGRLGWSYQYRRMIPELLAAGHRVVAPDLIGFGKSDKPKKEGGHRFIWHRQIVQAFVERLDLQHVVLVGLEWGGLLGLTLPMATPARYQGLLLMNTVLPTGDELVPPEFSTWHALYASQPDEEVSLLLARAKPPLTPQESAAYDAPFPDRGHRAALRAFPFMGPDSESADGAHVVHQARDFLRHEWQGQSLMVAGEPDQAQARAALRYFKPR